MCELTESIVRKPVDTVAKMAFMALRKILEGEYLNIVQYMYMPVKLTVREPTDSAPMKK